MEVWRWLYEKNPKQRLKRMPSRRCITNNEKSEKETSLQVKKSFSGGTVFWKHMGYKFMNYHISWNLIEEEEESEESYDASVSILCRK